MPGNKDTRQLLNEVTDAGLFERLATALLRELDPRCRRLVHVGVNAEGKTVTSPSDAVGYVRDDDSLRMVVAHHTTCRRNDLPRKWLDDSDSDFEKTRRVVDEQRNRIGGLQATLIVTTNREPAEGLINDIYAAGHDADIDVEVYTASIIAHFLDTHPKGQWIRRKYLGVTQMLLSEELLRELSQECIDAVGLTDAESWIQRDFNKQLAIHALSPVTFVVGESGMGKTVACLQCLEDHVAAGGLGLVITDDVVRTSRTLADAVSTTLRELHQPLGADEGRLALSFSSEAMPLLVVVEDVNQSASPVRLLEKLASWNEAAQKDPEPVRWRVLCPVWPRTTDLLKDDVHKSVSRSSVWLSSFSEEEGIAAVQRRRTTPLPVLDAKAIAMALGYDPLLIALHSDSDSAPEPTSVVRKFVERSLERLAASDGSHTAGEYRFVLTWLSLEMLKHKQLEPVFTDVVEWARQHACGADEELREIFGSRELARLEGPVERQRIVFRHDRVRDHLLADAVAHALQQDELSVSIMADPYFAEVIGSALLRDGVTVAATDRVAARNPLALFSAMRHFRDPSTEVQRHVIDASYAWAHRDAHKDTRNGALQQTVLRTLAECEGAHVRPLSERIDGEGVNWWALRARFRNGEVLAGVRLCGRFEPGVRVVGHVELIEHVLAKIGPEISHSLGVILRRRDLSETERRGALRLAGYVGTPLLAEALHESWRVEELRTELLADYLWACSQCCAEGSTEFLEPIFDEWAMMPEEGEKDYERPRVSLGANQVRWAFIDKVPHRAIGYFLRQAMRSELRSSVLVMLNGIDAPDAVEFVVRELARMDEEWEGTGRWSPLGWSAVNEWSRRPEFGRSPMKEASRQRLLALWSNEDHGKHLRRRALQFWGATVSRGDIPTLRTVATSDEIGDTALFQRLRRGDETAIPDLLERLAGDHPAYWWQAGRYLWSEELSECLDSALGRIAGEATEARPDGSSNLDWILSERLMELPSATAERLIEKHWVGLSRSTRYVQAALYVASPGLLKKVREIVAQHDDPASLFRLLNFGIRTKGRRGITRREQMEALLPYLDHFSDLDVGLLWEACNENGWFDWRRVHLDARVKEAGSGFVDGVWFEKRLEGEMARTGDLFLVDNWVELFLRTGISLDDLMELLRNWLASHSATKALRIAADIVTRFGLRSHLEILYGHSSAQSEYGKALIEDASFGLRLRSLE